MRRKKKTSATSKSKGNALGLFQVLLFTTFFYLLNGDASSPLESKFASAQSARLPFRPIGTESAVDRYSEPGRSTETRYHQSSAKTDPRPQSYANSGAPVRQVSMQSGSFSEPPTGSGIATQPMQLPTQFAPPPLSTPPGLSGQGTRQPTTIPTSPRMTTGPASDAAPLAPPTLPFNNASPPTASVTPRTLPSSTPTTPSYSVPPIADYAPVAPPQLSNGGYATMADCRLITPPSSYSAMSPYGDTCGSVAPTNYASPYNPFPAQISAPAVMPPMAASPPVAAAPSITTLPPVITPPVTSLIAAPSAAPVGSLVTFGQETLPVQVGQGLWGQPVAYVPGQRCRNWLRYLSF